MDHSESECQARLNGESCEKLFIERTRQHPSVRHMKKFESSPKDWAQNQYKSTEYWFDRNRCLSPKNENESESSSQLMIDCNSDSAEEWKTETLVGVCGEVDQVPRNYNELHQSTRSYTELEESSSSITTKRVENEIFSGAIIDVAEMGDDFSFSLDLESDSEIQVAVNEIRKEAEKIDTILVLDQFKTLQTEFESMQNKYSMKTIENEDLKTRLQESENRVAHMELERDLLHADAEKLREDLKTLVSKMFDISMYESSDPVDENIVSIKETADTCRSHKRLGYPMPPIDPSKEGTCSTEPIIGNRDIQRYETNETSSPRENIRILGLIDQPRHATRQLRRLSDPLVYSEHNAHGSTSSDSDTTCLLPESKPLRNQNIFRMRRNCVKSRIRMDSSRTKQQRNLPLCSENTVGEKIEGTAIYRHRSLSHVETRSTSLVTEMYDAEEETEKRRCGKIFRRRRKQRLFSKQDVFVLMKKQIYQLNERMKTSTAT